MCCAHFSPQSWMDLHLHSGQTPLISPDRVRIPKPSIVPISPRSDHYKIIKWAAVKIPISCRCCCCCWNTTHSALSSSSRAAHHSRLLVDQESPSAPQQVTRLWLPETLASHSYVISMYYCEKCNGDNTHVSPVCNPSITMHNTYCEGPDGRSRVTQNIRTEGVGPRREICLQ